jgi:hypothetical protein
MFHQLKTVYETEVDMMRRDEEKKVKRSLATHALRLQTKREEVTIKTSRTKAILFLTLIISA